MKDRLWWYGAARHTVTGQRYPTLVDAVQDMTVPVYTGKGTFNLTSNQKVIGFYHRFALPRNFYLDFSADHLS